MQHCEQARAVNADTENVRQAKVRIGGIEHNAPVLFDPFQRINTRTARQHLVCKPKFFQNRKAAWLDHEARTNRLRGIKLVVDRDRMAPFVKQQTRGKSCWSAPGDRDIDWPHGDGLWRITRAGPTP